MGRPPIIRYFIGLLATYLVKYEATAITWFMIFYKVRDTWVLNEFNYDILSNANFIVTSSDASCDIPR